jgi:hypothetical protein
MDAWPWRGWGKSGVGDDSERGLRDAVDADAPHGMLGEG